MEAARRVHALLQQRDQTLATAESVTGGRLAAELTAVPGSSRSYLGGVVSYATSVKETLLGVPEALIDEHGVISAECALAMARGAVRATGATWAVATTGVAGPDRQEGHPAGTVHVGLVGPGVARTVALELVGDRSQIQDRACREALSALAAVLEAPEDGAPVPPREDGRLG